MIKSAFFAFVLENKDGLNLFIIYRVMLSKYATQIILVIMADRIMIVILVSMADRTAVCFTREFHNIIYSVLINF